MTVYATYRSAITSCNSGFLSSPKEELKFPGAVLRLCFRCKKEHQFNLDHTSNVTSNHHKEALYNITKQSGYETDVSIN